MRADDRNEDANNENGETDDHGDRDRAIKKHQISYELMMG
jgi:hypothetical protein